MTVENSAEGPFGASVVIIGGGPVGLSTALGLAHHGVRSVLVEQDPGAQRESRTINLWARALETFRDWGVLDDLLAKGTFEDRLEPVDAATDQMLFSFPLSGLAAETPLAGVLMIPQNVTEDVLRARVLADPACQVVIGRCTGVEQDEHGVRVALESPEGRRTIEAAYCVGADGARSTVRRLLGIPLTGNTYPQRMVLSDEVVEGAVAGRVRIAIRTKGFHVAVRFGERRWRVMSSLAEGVSDKEATSPPAMDARVALLFGERAHTTHWVSTFGVHQRIAERYRSGRVLLAGDAAHLISPIGGQGMSAGILDAENLCWKLAAVLQDGAGEQLLDSYHDERRWAMATKISHHSGNATQAELHQPPALKRLMIKVLGLGLAIPPVRNRIARNLSMLKLRYPSSTVFLGDHPLVGVRLADPVASNGNRFSDLLRARTAVLFVNGAKPVPAPGTATHALDRAPKAWRLREPAAVIVRPDRHVAAVLIRPGASEVASALDTMLCRTGVVRRGPARQ